MSVNPGRMLSNIDFRDRNAGCRRSELSLGVDFIVRLITLPIALRGSYLLDEGGFVPEDLYR